VKPIMRLHVRPPQSTAEHRRTLRELVRAGCENKPGTYRMLSSNGTVMYVGQSRVLRTRLLSYFRARGSRNKSARILRHAFNIQWEYAPTEFGALLRELRLIKLHRPHFNSQMVTDESPRGYVALVGGAVPGLRVVARSDYPDAEAMYGPFRKVGALREAVRALSEITGVRDCTIDGQERGTASRTLWFANAMGNLKPTRVGSRAVVRAAVRERVAGCLRYELDTCPGPCIGQGDARHYEDSVARARGFLDGSSNAVLISVHDRMLAAAEQLEFERAASLRNRLARLSWLHERLHQFHASVDRLTFRYHAIGPEGSEHVYLVRRGTVRAERAAPVHANEISDWEAQAQHIFSGADPSGADVPLHDLDEFHLIASWFRRRPLEQAKTRLP
jgi:excinuclease UvrABC nuclease subunit